MLHAHTPTTGFYADAIHDARLESSADDHHYALILSARYSRRCSFFFLLAETMVQKLTLEVCATLSNTTESVPCILLPVGENHQAGKHG
jgi:hypothetical protein